MSFSADKPFLSFTDAAANKVWQLMCEESNPNLKLRVYITGGGCSGFQYGFAFEDAAQSDDNVVAKHVNDKGNNHEVQLLIDPLSGQYLVDAEIDYREDLHGEQFVIRNPNAQTTCGCGSSFSPA